MLDGFNSINDILVYWSAGEEILRNDNTGAHFLKSLANLYSSIIEYQASVICHMSKDQGSRALHSVVGAVDWATMAQTIAKLNTACKDLVDISCRAEMQRANDMKLQGIQDIIVALEQNERRTRDRERDEKETALLRDLDCPYESYKDFNRRRVQGTCGWFFNDDRFHAWRDASTSSLLWVSAGPGCGKSVLARAIVDDLSASTAGGSATVCHFFFKDGNEGQKLGANAVSAILHKLFKDAPKSLMQHALPSHRNCGKRLAQDFLELWKILTNCAQSDEARQIICILDALDECEPRSRNELIFHLKQFYADQQNTSAKASKLKFIITSRPYDDLEIQFARFATVNYIQFHGDDKSAEISREIDFVIDELVEEVAGTFSGDDQESLKSHLKRMENRTYLWLHLTFDIIRQSPSEFGRPCEIGELLSILPSEVADAYDKILNRSRNKERTETILHIVLAAEKPLTLHEANNALAMAFALQKKNSPPPPTSVEIEKQLWPDDTFKSVVTNLCGLFVSVYDEKLVFIHKTARDFLVGPRSEQNAWQGRFDLPKSHSVMSSICIRYLLLRDLPHSVEDYDNDRFTRHVEFITYAAEHWHQHFNAQEPTSRTDLLSDVRILLDTTDNRNHVWLCVTSDFDELNPLTSLGLANHFHLTSAVEDMLKTDKVNINECDMYGETALYGAAEQGHMDIVRLLLDNGADIHVQDKFDETPLHSAAEQGHTDIVRLLLDNGADIHAQTESGQTPLHGAAKEGHIDTVQLLLDNGADIHVQAEYRGTPIHGAAGGGHTDIVRLLLDNGADIHVQAGMDGTPLHAAAGGGYMDIVRLLLDSGADIHVQSEYDGTPLHSAAMSRHQEIVQLFLDMGADVNTRSALYGTPLDSAAKYGATKNVRLLLENGADVHVRGGIDGTPLRAAAAEGHVEIVRLLLDNGADIDAQSTYDETALFEAAVRGKTGVVWFLIDNGAKVNVLSNCGQSILHYAARTGFPEVIRLLLDNGADIHVQTANGNTALHVAAENGRTMTARLFLDSGANIDAQNKNGQTAIYMASQANRMGVVQLLLEYGADAFIQDVHGKTALEARPGRSLVETIQLFSMAFQVLRQRLIHDAEITKQDLAELEKREASFSRSVAKQDIDRFVERMASLDRRVTAAHRLVENLDRVNELTALASSPSFERQ